MLITAYFTDKGIPKTGLFPIIDIWKSDKTLIVNAQTMTERIGGFYDYDFITYDDTENYSFRADSIVLTGYDRYKYNTNETEYNIKLFDIQTDLDSPDQYKADISDLALETTVSGIPGAVWGEFVAGNTVSGTFGKLLSDIKVEVDAITIKLPSGDIAESGEYTTLLSNIETYILRNLGLSQENYYLDQTVYVTYQEAKLLTGGRIRVYSDAVSVGTDSNIIATYVITASWTDDKLQTYKVVKQ